MNRVTMTAPIPGLPHIVRLQIWKRALPERGGNGRRKPLRSRRGKGICRG